MNRSTTIFLIGAQLYRVNFLFEKKWPEAKFCSIGGWSSSVRSSNTIRKLEKGWSRSNGVQCFKIPNFQLLKKKDFFADLHCKIRCKIRSTSRIQLNAGSWISSDSWSLEISASAAWIQSQWFECAPARFFTCSGLHWRGSCKSKKGNRTDRTSRTPKTGTKHYSFRNCGGNRNKVV